MARKKKEEKYGNLVGREVIMATREDKSSGLVGCAFSRVNFTEDMRTSPDLVKVVLTDLIKPCSKPAGLNMYEFQIYTGTTDYNCHVVAGNPVEAYARISEMSDIPKERAILERVRPLTAGMAFIHEKSRITDYRDAKVYD